MNTICQNMTEYEIRNSYFVFGRITNIVPVFIMTNYNYYLGSESWSNTHTNIIWSVEKSQYEYLNSELFARLCSG